MVETILGMLAGAGLLGARSYVKSKDSVDDTILRAEAQKAGKPFYRDRIGIIRNTATGNCTEQRVEYSNHIYLFDAKTKRFICDMTFLAEQEQNEERLKKGKKFIVKSFPQFGTELDHNMQYVVVKKKVDIENNLPYDIRGYYDPVKQETRYTMWYIDPESTGYKKIGKRELTREEAHKYYMEGKWK